MNSTWLNSDTKSLDHLASSISSTLSYNQTREILFIIGLITVCILLFIMLIQFLMKVRDTYRSSQPIKRKSRSLLHQKRYLSYQDLINPHNHRCNCLNYSCLPKLQCIKPSSNSQILLNQSPYYEQIDERQTNNSILTHNNRSSIRIHTVK